MAIEVELFDDLDAVARDAAGALDRDRQAWLYDRLDWFRLTHEHCPGNGDILVARAKDADGRQAWLFLAGRGRRAEALASWYTLAYRPIFAGPDVDRPGLLAAIARKLQDRFDSIALFPLPDPASLVAAFAASGWFPQTTKTSSNWLADCVDKSFANYWAERPGQLRATVRRKTAAAIEFRIYRDFEEKAWKDYEEVYRSSWKPAEGAPAFLRALAVQEGLAGTLRLGIAYQAGQPVAAQFWLVENGVATIHKLAHVEAERHLSPGTLLSEAMFRHVLEQDRPRLIDFGTGDDRYKADWMDRREPLWRVDLFNRRTMRGRLGALRARLSTLVRRRWND
jgi:hypothetical protein